MTLAAQSVGQAGDTTAVLLLLLYFYLVPVGMKVAVRFAGADEAFYGLMAAQLARSCGIKSFYGDSCPSVIAYSGSSAAACTGASAWPPVHGRQQPPEGPAVEGGGAGAGDKPGTPSSILCLASTEDKP